MTSDEFSKLLDVHWLWQKGIFITEDKKENGVILYFGPLKSEFFNMAIPVVDDPEKLNLDLVKKEFLKHDRIPSFYLTEDFQKKGFNEYLIKNGFTSAGDDTWMVLDGTIYKNEQPKSEVIEISPEKFADYYSVLSPVFKDFPANEEYLKICKDSISDKTTSEAFGDFKSELFLIYDEGNPASGGGMFYSVKGNFAYLHDAGTLEKFRGRGYQTDLIRYRANKALSLGITRIYSIVECGSQSWKNMIKNGFAQAQKASVLVVRASK